MVSCSACGRSRVRATTEQNITFHLFPKDPDRRRKWIEFVNKPNWVPSSHAYLCSQHFEDVCFDRTSLAVVRLRPETVPTIFIQRHKYVRQNYAQKIMNIMPMSNYNLDYTNQYDIHLYSPVTKMNVEIKNKKLKKLEYKKRRQEKRIEYLKSILTRLKKRKIF